MWILDLVLAQGTLVENCEIQIMSVVLVNGIVLTLISWF